MAKNIVICCDGTGNEFGMQNSNVIKLYSVLDNGTRQVAYYHPGVGTLGAQATLTSITGWWTRVSRKSRGRYWRPAAWFICGLTTKIILRKW